MNKAIIKGTDCLSLNIKRIISDQIRKSIELSLHMKDDPHTSIHEIRKCMKRIRAILRLIRGETGYAWYRRENIFYRDTARSISSLRDLMVFRESLEYLRKKYPPNLPDPILPPIIEAIDGEMEKQSRELIMNPDLTKKIRKDLELAEKRLSQMPFNHEDFSALKPGLSRVYRRGKKAMQRAYNETIPFNLHYWRKRAKYLMYILEIFQPVWSGMLNSTIKKLYKISDALGIDHDLSELNHYLVENQSSLKINAPEMSSIASAISAERNKVQRKAFENGKYVYGEKVKSFVNRIEAYWNSHYDQTSVPG